jgi:hypothetical protein
MVVEYNTCGVDIKKLATQMLKAMPMVVILPIRRRNGYIMAK